MFTQSITKLSDRSTKKRCFYWATSLYLVNRSKFRDWCCSTLKKMIPKLAGSQEYFGKLMHLAQSTTASRNATWKSIMQGGSHTSAPQNLRVLSDEPKDSGNEKLFFVLCQIQANEQITDFSFHCILKMSQLSWKWLMTDRETGLLIVHIHNSDTASSSVLLNTTWCNILHYLSLVSLFY